MSAPSDGSGHNPEEHEPLRHPGRSRGSHAAPPSPVRQLVRSLLAVAAVAAFVAALLHWRGDSASTAGLGPVVTHAPALPTATATAAPTRTPSPAPSPTQSATPRRTHTPKPSPTRITAPLDVLNNSTRTGLAHRAAAEFQAKGWPIEVIGNFRGQIAVTTVYFEPGNERQKAAAQWLHKQFPEVQRVHPRFEGLPGDGLTVVLTAEYPA